jgi:hypothetical protein
MAWPTAVLPCFIFRFLYRPLYDFVRSLTIAITQILHD